jgi:hypothetical protein
VSSTPQYCATSWKVTDSIPDGVGIFLGHNPSDRTVLGSTQLLTEMITWGGVKAAGA